jgi:hypothetical protein
VRLPDDLDPGDLAEQKTEFLARELLIVNNDRPK